MVYSFKLVLPNLFNCLLYELSLYILQEPMGLPYFNYRDAFSNKNAGFE
jgi:hypothetical protein